MGFVSKNGKCNFDLKAANFNYKANVKLIKTYRLQVFKNASELSKSLIVPMNQAQGTEVY